MITRVNDADNDDCERDAPIVLHDLLVSHSHSDPFHRVPRPCFIADRTPAVQQRHLSFDLVTNCAGDAAHGPDVLYLWTRAGVSIHNRVYILLNTVRLLDIKFITSKIIILPIISTHCGTLQILSTHWQRRNRRYTRMGNIFVAPFINISFAYRLIKVYAGFDDLIIGRSLQSCTSMFSWRA